MVIVNTSQAKNFPMLFARLADQLQGPAKDAASELAWNSKLDSEVVRADKDDIRALDRCYVIDVL